MYIDGPSITVQPAPLKTRYDDVAYILSPDKALVDHPDKSYMRRLEELHGISAIFLQENFADLKKYFAENHFLTFRLFSDGESGIIVNPLATAAFRIPEGGLSWSLMETTTYRKEQGYMTGYLKHSFKILANEKEIDAIAQTLGFRRYAIPEDASDLRHRVIYDPHGVNDEGHLDCPFQYCHLYETGGGNGSGSGHFKRPDHADQVEFLTPQPIGLNYLIGQEGMKVPIHQSTSGIYRNAFSEDRVGRILGLSNLTQG